MKMFNFGRFNLSLAWTENFVRGHVPDWLWGFDC